MPHSHPTRNPSSTYRTPPNSIKRPYLPSIASSSVFLTPIQEQRILSWRTHAGPPLTPLASHSAPVLTPGLTPSASATTGNGAGSPRSSSLCAPAQRKETNKAKVRSAPSSLIAPAGGSLCQACGGSCGCSTLSRVTHPIGRKTALPRDGRSGMREGFDSPAETETGTGTGTSSRQRSYYSTKKYRQARAAEMREQSGFGNGAGAARPGNMGSGSDSRSGSGMAGGGGMGQDVNGGQNQQMAEGESAEQVPNAGMQPEWGTTSRDPTQVHMQAAPVANPTPRIGGARDPISQNYWRNMYPPTGPGPSGISSGMPIHPMGPAMGMGVFHQAYATPPGYVAPMPPGMMFH